MHQIVWRPGLRPGPHWGSLQRSPRPPSWLQGSRYAAGRGEEGKVRGEEGKGRGEEGREEEGREGKRREGKGPPTYTLAPSHIFLAPALILIDMLISLKMPFKSLLRLMYCSQKRKSITYAT